MLLTSIFLIIIWFLSLILNLFLIMSKSLQPSKACEMLFNQIDVNYDILKASFRALPEDAYPLFLGYLDTLNVLICRSETFISEINKNPNF